MPGDLLAVMCHTVSALQLDCAFLHKGIKIRGKKKKDLIHGRAYHCYEEREKLMYDNNIFRGGKKKPLLSRKLSLIYKETQLAPTLHYSYLQL